MKLLRLIAILLVLTVVSLQCTQSPKFGVINAHSMVYNKTERRAYLFGGATEREVVNDLWYLENSKWYFVETEAKPLPRTFSSLVYDPRGERLILFGGNSVLFGDGSIEQPLLNDTWEFKNGKWKELHPDTSPSSRAEASIVFDEERNKIVLFGGYEIINGEYIKLGDTWEFNNANWVRVSEDGPSPRHGAPMVYDEENKTVILFGGSTTAKDYGEEAGETWGWNGQEWIKFDLDQPPNIFNSQMAYDPKNKRVVRFGGWDGSKRIDETWQFRDETWNKLQFDQTPSARNHHTMIWDPQEGYFVLTGGHNGKLVFGDTWKLEENGWINITSSAPLNRVDNGH